MLVKQIQIGIFLTCFLLSLELCANTYYFSSFTGSDDHTDAQAQSPNTPWRSLEQLNLLLTKINPGDSILLKRGDVFYGNIVINQSGSQEAPIYIGAYGDGDRPVISGFQENDAYEMINEEVAVLPLPGVSERVNVVLFDNEVQPMGRYPNLNSENGGYLPIEQVRNHMIISRLSHQNENFTNGELVVRSTPWIIDRFQILQHQSRKFFYNNTSDYTPEAEMGFFIQHHPGTLDQPGEWYHDVRAEKLRVFISGRLHSNAQVKASIVQDLVSINGNYIKIKDISLVGANRYGVWTGGNLVRSLQLVDCHIQYIGVDALHLPRVFDLRVDNCTIQNVLNNAITIDRACLNAQITNNTIEAIGYIPGMGLSGDGNYNGMYNRRGGMLVQNNVIKRVGYIGIDFGGPDVEISNNLIDSFCLVKSDGGGIYTYTDEQEQFSKPRKINANIVVNGIGNTYGLPGSFERPAEGIYLDDNSANIEVLGNTVANCGGHGIFIHNAQEVVVAENTLFDNQVQLAVKDDQLGGPVLGIEVRRNVLFAQHEGKMMVTLDNVRSEDRLVSLEENLYAFEDSRLAPFSEVYSNEYGQRVQEAFDDSTWLEKHEETATFERLHFLAAIGDESIQGQNKFLNSNFDSGEANWWAYSDNAFEIGIVNEADFNGNSLQVRGNGQFVFGIDVGSTEAQRPYLLKFKAKAPRKTSARIRFRQLDDPWQDLSPWHSVLLEKGVRLYELVLFNQIEENAAALVFEIGTSGEQSLMLDDIQLFPLEPIEASVQKVARIVFQEGTSGKPLVLKENEALWPGSDLGRKIIVNPYQSVILIKTIDAE